MNMHFSPYLEISQNQRGPSAQPCFLNPPEICGLDKPSGLPAVKHLQIRELEGLEDPSVHAEHKKETWAVPL